ncbi:MAG: ATP-binding cassette domain-containing protein [Pseudomonadota bacterium]
MQDGVQIECRNIWKVFGDEPSAFLSRHNGHPTDADLKNEGYIGAVRDVSFDVHAGEILIIMGLSGSGKSTIIRCMTRLNDPTSGEIQFEGENLLAADDKQMIEIRRHKMGMVFQNFGLLPHRDVMSNVAFPLEVQGLERSEREARARQMIELVGLGGRESYFPRELSGGQQQRVGIARSLAVEPDVWFLDEPFSALDPLIRSEMQDEFIRLQRMLKKTIVFITHDFEEATKLADRIGIMKDGRLVQLSTPEEMILHPADDYVAEFARNAPRDRIVSVRAVMTPTKAKKLKKGDGINGKLKIGDVAEQVINADKPLNVISEENQIIGTITREQISQALFGAEIR